MPHDEPAKRTRQAGLETNGEPGEDDAPIHERTVLYGLKIRIQ
jgi:hypothetical protein